MPHVYYPWLIGKLVPFWHKMQHEVGPGNRPGGDIRALHGMLQDHISNKLDIREDEYPEDFDVFASGSLDTLLIECYERMVVPNDIKYNGTVWRDGLSFMTNAIAMMPLPIIEKFKVEHPEKKDFITYIEANHAYWNKTESSDWK